MNPPQKAKAKRPAESWDSPGIADELEPIDQLAHSIVTARPDLRPSVLRIMSASLPTADRQRALTLFAASLNNPGDPNRDPRVAIERCVESPTA